VANNEPQPACLFCSDHGLLISGDAILKELGFRGEIWQRGYSGVRIVPLFTAKL
jgi:hypothetical protein